MDGQLKPHRRRDDTTIQLLSSSCVSSKLPDTALQALGLPAVHTALWCAATSPIALLLLQFAHHHRAAVSAISTRLAGRRHHPLLNRPTALPKPPAIIAPAAVALAFAKRTSPPFHAPHQRRHVRTFAGYVHHQAEAGKPQTLAMAPSSLSPNFLASLRHASARERSRIALGSEEASNGLKERSAE